MSIPKVCFYTATLLVAFFVYMTMTPNDNNQIVKELYWIAHYDNGESLKQFENGKENKYADINRERLFRFDLLDRATDKAVYSLYLREGQQLIFRRRTLKQINKPDVVLFLVGWKMTVMASYGAKEIIAINYIYPDGSIALDGARNNLELLPVEN